MVIGGGGREHAIIKKLKESKTPLEIFALPGNGGIAADATCVPVGAKDIDGMVSFAKENNIEFLSACGAFQISEAVHSRYSAFVKKLAVFRICDNDIRRFS